MKWFKHDSRANRDAKLEKVLLKYGADGYALYWLCIELIADRIDSTCISFELEHDAETLGFRLKLDTQRVEEILRYFIDLQLFESTGATITCLKLAARLDNAIVKNPELNAIKKAIASTSESEEIPENPGKSRMIPDDPGKVRKSPEKSGQIRLDKIRLEEKNTQERAREEDQEPIPEGPETRMLNAIPRPLPPSDLPPGFSKTIHDALMAHPGWKIKPQAYAFGWPNEWRDISPCVKGIPPDDILYAIKAYGDIRAGPPGKYWVKFDVGPRTFFQKHLTRFLPGATPYESLLGEEEGEEAKARRLAEECVARGKKEEVG